jgi:xanthine dehydrogenase accessory factor
VVLELPFPRAVRRTVSYSSAVHDGEIAIEGVKGVHCTEIPPQRGGFIPVLADPDGRAVKTWHPDILIDARMRKKPAEPLDLKEDCFVLGIGPDFEVGMNCHAIVETDRGHSLGRVLWTGRAAANTRVPGAVCGYTNERVLRSPQDGTFVPLLDIGGQVEAGQLVGRVDGSPVTAKINGILRGVLYPHTPVSSGQKVGDIDPRMDVNACFTVSDKSNAIAGGALEAAFTWLNNLRRLVDHAPDPGPVKSSPRTASPATGFAGSTGRRLPSGGTRLKRRY